MVSLHMAVLGWIFQDLRTYGHLAVLERGAVAVADRVERRDHVAGEAAGLFHPERKRPLPLFPRYVVNTSGDEWPTQHRLLKVRDWLRAHVPAEAFASYDTREGFEQHRRWEATLQRDLWFGDDYFPEHLIESLLRGDTKSRYEAYGKGIQDGWFTRNEARERENLNPIEGLDTFRRADAARQAGYSCAIALPYFRQQAIAGVLVLYAALASSRDERVREAGLLRALGASRKQLSQAQWIEFTLVGGLSGLLAASGALLFVEFFADKIPVVDSLWDMVNSVVRIPAGAALAAGVFGADSGAMALAAALLGGSLAATSQAAKTTTRAAINASPEPFSNIAMSLVEDGLVVGAVWLATNHPVAGSFALVGVLTSIHTIGRTEPRKPDKPYDA